MPSPALVAQVYSLLITLLLLLGSCADRSADKPGHIMRAILLTNAALLFCYIGSWLLDGRAEYEALNYALTLGKCGIGFPLAALYAEYVFLVAEEHGRTSGWFLHAIRTACAGAFFLVFLSAFNHMYFSCAGGHYVRGPLYLLNQGIAVAIIGAVALYILFCRVQFGWRNALALLSYAVLPVLAVAWAVAFPRLLVGQLSLATTLSLLIIYLTVYVNRGRRLLEEEQELLHSRVAVMLSQIQPHFLYNALGTIQELCHGKAPEAEEATREFAEFLRGNLDSLRTDKPISFEMELRHTRNYLSLEEKRFGERLHVEYDIGATLFRLPALTLQPIVENAVRYGIMQREEGGTVRIESRERENGYTVTVTDDGVGFDVMTPKKDGRTHIGILNVRDRLAAMVCGTLTITSTPDVGTVAVIFVPKGAGPQELPDVPEQKKDRPPIR